MTEKRHPTYNLTAFKAAFSSVGKLAVTRLERILTGLLLLPLVLTACLLGARLLWQAVPPRIRGRMLLGSELGLYALALVLGSWVCVCLSPRLESALFAGSFPTWLLHATGLAYDQRNAVWWSDWPWDLP